MEFHAFPEGKLQGGVVRPLIFRGQAWLHLHIGIIGKQRVKDVVGDGICPLLLSDGGIQCGQVIALAEYDFILDLHVLSVTAGHCFLWFSCAALTAAAACHHHTGNETHGNCFFHTYILLKLFIIFNSLPGFLCREDDTIQNVPAKPQPHGWDGCIPGLPLDTALQTCIHPPY